MSLSRVKSVAKAVVAVATAVVGGLETFVLPDSPTGRACYILTLVLGAVGVYLTPNAPMAKPEAAPAA